MTHGDDLTPGSVGDGLPLVEVLAALDAILAEHDGARPEPLCVRARIADWFRRRGRDPMDAIRFTEMSADLDGDGWQRLALIEGMMGAPAVRATLAALLRESPAESIVSRGMLEVACQLRLLTLEALRKSAHRREELARAWIYALGLPIAGENSDTSARHRLRLDFARTLDAQRETQDEACARKDYLEHLWSQHA